MELTCRLALPGGFLLPVRDRQAIIINQIHEGLMLFYAVLHLVREREEIW